MSLRRSLGSGVAAVALAAAIATPIGAQPASARPDVRVGEAAEFTRLDFGPGVSTRRDGVTLTVTFPAGARPDLSRFRTTPPRWIKAARVAQAGARTQLVLTLADDADLRSGTADGAVWVNLFQKPPPPEGQAAAASAKAAEEEQRKLGAISSSFAERLRALQRERIGRLDSA